MQLGEIKDPKFRRTMNKIQGAVGAGPSQTLQDCFVSLDDLKENIHKINKETKGQYAMILDNALEGIIAVVAELNKLTKDIPLP